jgi:hypothetical protein
VSSTSCAVNGEAVDPLTLDGVCGEVVCEGLPQLAILSHHRKNLGHLCSLLSTGSSSSSNVSSNSSGSRHQTAMSRNTNIRPVFVYTAPQNSDVSENSREPALGLSSISASSPSSLHHQSMGSETRVPSSNEMHHVYHIVSFPTTDEHNTQHTKHTKHRTGLSYSTDMHT